MSSFLTYNNIFDAIYKKYKSQPNNQKYIEPKVMEHSVFNLIMKRKISDFRFLELINFDNLKANELSQLLEAFQNSKLTWNSKAILNLINEGVTCRRLIGASEYGQSFEDDYFTTLLIKDYCERYIEK